MKAKEMFIIVYSRVSSAAQTLAMQIGLAKHYMDRENIAQNEVKFIDDHDVSATKLSMYERKGLRKLIELIEAGSVQKIIIYKRDRIARNFYEYSELVKLFIKYDVEIIFTAANEPPYSGNLALESFYGIFSQMEDKNIQNRTNDARKQFPSNIVGYKRNKIDGAISYTANPDKADIVRSLFEAASQITSSEMFNEFLIAKHPFKFEQKIKILTNVFYAGYFQKSELFHQLAYVEPLIDLDLFKKVSLVIDSYISDFYSAIEQTPKLLYKMPICACCNNIMKIKKQHILEPGEIYCSNGHQRNSISVVEYHQQISAILHEEVLKFQHSHLQSIVIKTLKNERTLLNKHLKKLEHNHLTDLLALTSAFDSVDAHYEKSLTKIDKLKKSIAVTYDEIEAIDQLVKETTVLMEYVASFNVTLNQEDLINIADLLIEEVFIGNDFISISLFLVAIESDVS